MPSIAIARSSRWNGPFRSFRIFIDGKVIGEISPGETKVFEVEPGYHVVRAKISRFGSREFRMNIEEGETISLQVSGFKFSGLVFPAALSLSFIAIIGSPFFPVLNYVFYLVTFPAFLLLLYYLTIGKDDYLRLNRS